MKEYSGIAWELYSEKTKMLGYCLLPTPNLSQIAIFTKHPGKTKGEPSSEYLTKNKVNYSLFVAQLPPLSRGQSSTVKAKKRGFPLII